MTPNDLPKYFAGKVKVDPTSGCWIWTRSTDKNGYGKAFQDNRHRRAHCLVYEWHKKTNLKHGDLVCHTCDNPSCVNPLHLWLGTPLSNMQDKIRKGRLVACYGDDNGTRKHPECVRRGESHPHSRHSDEFVREVVEYAKSHSQTQAANKYGLTVVRVHKWLRGKARRSAFNA